MDGPAQDLRPGEVFGTQEACFQTRTIPHEEDAHKQVSVIGWSQTPSPSSSSPP